MADQAADRSRDPAVTSRIMSKIRGKDGKAEWLLRRSLFAEGIRYRKHYGKLPGTPDIVIVRSRLAIFLDGDFWHGNGWRLRGLPDLASQFPNRTDYWVKKITRNIERDKRVTDELTQSGWQVIRFWESEVLQDVEACVRRVLQSIGEAQIVSRRG